MTGRRSARELIDTVVDPGSWLSWDEPASDPPSASRRYRAELAAARQRTGLDEAVLTGAALLRGRRVAVLAGEFGFLAGSIGVVAAQRLARAVERATAGGLPLLAAPASGGTRMQEGTDAFVQMVTISAAVAEHKRAGLPYLVYLRHPTTGGVFASWGSLGHLTVAEPGALIGFLGPRVYEALYGAPFPEHVQTAENLHRRGLVDAVLAAEQIPDILARTLSVLCADRTGTEPGTEPGTNLDVRPGVDPDEEAPPDPDAWEAILRSRDPLRPGVRRLLRYAATDVVTLNGTGEGERDPGLLLALARIGGVPCVFLGQDRRGQTADAPLGPGALREARRGMRLAAELGLPLVSAIDTPGAALSVEAEEGGLAGEIARCLGDLALLGSPTLTLLLGQGSGGGALALLPGDRVVAAQHAWLSPLPPEGASAIVHRSVERAPQMARAQGIRAGDLRRQGIVDRIVPERPDAAAEAEAFCRRVGTVLGEELRGLLAVDPDRRLAARLARYRALGR